MAILREFVTIEIVKESFGWGREESQAFLDLSVERGMAIPIEDGKYITKSEVILNKAKKLAEVISILNGEK